MAEKLQGTPGQEMAITALETEKVNPATTEIDRMSPLEIAQVMNAEDAKVAEAIKQELPQIARAIEEIAARLRRGGRLIYVGAGTSAPGCPGCGRVPPNVQCPRDYGYWPAGRRANRADAG